MRETSRAPAWARQLAWLMLGSLCVAFTLETALESQFSSWMVLNSSTHVAFVKSLGGEIHNLSPDYEDVPTLEFDVPFLAAWVISLGWSACGIGAASLLLKLRRLPFSLNVARWLERGWRWWCLTGLWSLLGLLALAFEWSELHVFIIGNMHFAIALMLAGWAAELARLLTIKADSVTLSDQAADWSVSRGVWVATALYVLAFSTMNWQLDRALLIPHGDSSMYEEHLWNVTHGKGFRSYLDQGLFLGEHVQIVHLFLLPLYVLWPTHRLLELCQTVALASSALPVFWMARRATGSRHAATLASVAYLLYPPMQFLDIAIDFKTFRPEAFVIPAMLFALDQWERGRIKSTLVCFAIALSAKEDYALILGPLGAWIALRPQLDRWLKRPTSDFPPQLQDRKRAFLFGICLTLFSVGYLFYSTRVVMRYFRSGEELHYVRYFAKFGQTFGEVIINMLTKPGLLLSELCTAKSGIYLMGTLAPLGFLPLLAPARLAVASPLLVLLCLNGIVQSDPFPRHHFQAPVVPLLIWAAIGGLRQICVSIDPSTPQRWWHRLRFWVSPDGSAPSPIVPATFLVASAFLANVFVSQSPLSIRFWDSHSLAYWRANYIPGPRAQYFQRVFDAIPQSARVASTDFVHPRFTHHERSYDYSHYARRVANYESRVPDDTDYIVIDTQHRYSDIKSPADVRELREEPDRWELLDLDTAGYFIVLKRRR